MKTKNFQSLMLVAVMILGLASCSEHDDNPVVPTPANDEIVGTFYKQYNAEGTVEHVIVKTDDSKETETSRDYTRVMEVYQFMADGTGVWNRYFFDQESGEPFADLGGGSGGLGHFSYTLQQGGTVSLTIDNLQSLPNADAYQPVNRTLTLADGKLTGQDINGQSLTMEKANDTWKLIFNDWNAKLHGAGDAEVDYNINDYTIKYSGKTYSPITADNWRQQGSIFIYVGGTGTAGIKDTHGEQGYEIVNMPWADITDTNLPSGFCDNITPENGWQWAYNLCGNRAIKNGNFFALYNKWTGILRFFYFMPDIFEAGPDHAWEVALTDELAKHSLLGYGLPSTQTVKNKSKICGDAGNTWSNYVTPYARAMSQDGVINAATGWWAFDVDLSLYRSDQIDLDANRITLQMRSWTTQHVSLWSTMTANIEGELKQKVKDAKGWSTSKTFQGIGLGLQAGFLVASSWASFTSRQPMGAATGLGAIASVFGCGGAFAGLFGGTPQPFEASISLGMNGTIDTQGIISSSSVTTGVASPTIRLSKFYSKNAPTLGLGVWNIMNHPKVYVYRWGFIWGKKMVSFPYLFDPSSINVELNPKVFPSSEVEWMQVDAHCIYNCKTGLAGTDNYREAFGLASRFRGHGNLQGIDTKLTKLTGDDLSTDLGALYYDYANFSNNKYVLEWPLHQYNEKKDSLIYGRGIKDNFLIEPGLLYGINYVKGKEDDKYYFGPVDKYVPGLEVNVVVHVKMKGMDNPIILSRNYLPEFVDAGSKLLNERCNSFNYHWVNPKQDGHRDSYDYQMGRFKKLTTEIIARTTD